MGVSAAAGWAIASLVTTALGTGYSIVQQRAAGRMEAAAAEENARFREAAAAVELQRGAQQAGAVRDRIRRLMAQQKAAYDTGNIDLSQSGMTLDTISGTAAEGEADALSVMSDAWRSAWGMNVEASDLRYRGKLARYGARGSSVATLISGAGSVMGGLQEGANSNWWR